MHKPFYTLKGDDYTFTRNVIKSLNLYAQDISIKFREDYKRLPNFIVSVAEYSNPVPFFITTQMLPIFEELLQIKLYPIRGLLRYGGVNYSFPEHKDSPGRDWVTSYVIYLKGTNSADFFVDDVIVPQKVNDTIIFQGNEYTHGRTQFDGDEILIIHSVYSTELGSARCVEQAAQGKQELINKYGYVENA